MLQGFSNLKKERKKVQENEKDEKFLFPLFSFLGLKLFCENLAAAEKFKKNVRGKVSAS